MHKIKEATSVISDLALYKNKELEPFELIKSVCDFYDKVKSSELNSADLRFLRYLSSIIGIPHYYELLSKFNSKDFDNEDYDLGTLSSIIFESTLHTDDEIMLHKYQKQVIDQFNKETSNRYFLSASTSFGKTYLIFEIIKRLDYQNVVLVFPTIALLTENLERIYSDERYSNFKNEYKIHTLSETEKSNSKNIFIYTPERFLSYLDITKDKDFDFVFVDEIYKMDNDYLIDETTKENERDTAYRIALHYILKFSKDILLAGPYIEFSSKKKSNYNSSFDNFIKRNDFTVLNYNNYEIVNKVSQTIAKKKRYELDGLTFEFDSKNKKDRFKKVVETIMINNENCIVYCSTKLRTENYAKLLLDDDYYHEKIEMTDLVKNFINHLENEYSSEWVVIRAIKKGIGIHHGLVPKYIQKEITDLFNDRYLNVLISTTTITEGVNTSAKNLIVLSERKGTKMLKKFDAKNISGRAGRFNHHYKGRVIVLQNTFEKVLESDEEGIKHKNYDENVDKDDVDLLYTDSEYLSDNDKIRLKELRIEIEKRKLPQYVFDTFKIISPIDKIRIYDIVKALPPNEYKMIKSVVSQIYFSMSYDFDDFQLILNIIRPIVKNRTLEFLIDYKVETKKTKKEYSVLTYAISMYLQDGFKGSLKYNLGRKNTFDEAMRETTQFVYNTLKYQVVKYLGVFNLIYIHIESEKTGKSNDDIVGITLLLKKLEHNALTDEGKLASDYGVPPKVIDYFESEDSSKEIRKTFDDYEHKMFDRVVKIMDK